MEVNKVNLQYYDENCPNNDLIKNNFDVYYDRCCYDGGGIELNNNHAYKTVISDDMTYANDHSVNVKMQVASRPIKNQPHEYIQWYDQQNMLTMYSKDGIHSYKLYIDWRDEYSSNKDKYDRYGHNNKISMQILNNRVYHEENWADVVYLMGHSDQITGYYLLLADQFGHGYTMTCCAHPSEGYLEVLRTIDCEILEILNVDNQMDIGSKVNQNPKLAYDNYCKDKRSWQYYQCDYITYITKNH